MPKIQSNSKKLQLSQAVDSKDSTDNCVSCGCPLRGSQFCKRCGPPKLPPNDEVNSMSSGKTVSIILLMISSFVAVANMKLGVGVKLFAKEPRLKPVVLKINQPQDKDFKVTHVVNVPMANVRKRSSKDGVIIMVLKKNEYVDILERRGRWARVAAHNKTGWIYNELLIAQVE